MLLHSFTMGDVEDPYLYAGFPLSEWQDTDQGKFVMEHVKEPPTFYCNPDPISYGYRVDVVGEFRDPINETYYKLKYGFPSTHK